MVATAAALACLVLATLAGLGYLVPTLAGLRRRRPPRRAPTHTFTILIPAHNEALALPRTLASLAALDYPPELVRVCVVADNCTDRTAAVARRAGARCLVRHDPGNRGKGFALAFGIARVLETAPDVVLVLDADCELNPGALRALGATFATGAAAVQAAVRSANADDGPSGLVAAVGTAFDAGTAAGWDALGFSVPLRGTGMAFRSAVLERVPWAAFGAVEDAEYAGRLKRSGVRVRYCPGAEVTCEAPASVGELCRQRRRWRGAGLLASKPLVLGLVAISIGAGWACGFVGWAAALLAVFGGLYLRALLAVGLTRRRFGALVRAPAVVGRLGLVTLAGVFRGAAAWDRPARAVNSIRRAG